MVAGMAKKGDLIKSGSPHKMCLHTYTINTGWTVLLSRDREELAQNGAKLSDRKDVKNCQKM